jgi:ElaB/YqjD/DUF883 family membrane-anchored ribosome-binding protein
MNASDKDNFRKLEQGVSDATASVADTVRDGGKAAARMVGDAGESLRDTANAVQDSAEDALDEGRSRISSVLHKVQDKAVDAKDAIVAGAGSTLTAVKDVAVDKADAARESLSDVGQRLAATLERASAEGEEDALKSRMLTSVAQGLTSASDALRHRSVTDLTSDVKALARKHPGAFMAAAAVVGFAAARFVRSSAQRRMAERDHDQGPRV